MECPQGDWAPAWGRWQESRPLFHPSFPPSTPAWVLPERICHSDLSLALVPSPECTKQKSASLKRRLVYKLKAFFFFFAEHFWALADYYFNFFPQMFSPYLGKARGYFYLLFHAKPQHLGEDNGFLGLLPIMGDPGLSLQDQLRCL